MKNAIYDLTSDVIVTSCEIKLVAFLRLGKSGALPCMGHIRSPQLLGNLLAVYDPDSAGVFLVWQTIVQRIKLQNVCNRIGDSCGYVLRSLLKLILKHYFSWFLLKIRVQNKTAH